MDWVVGRRAVPARNSAGTIGHPIDVALHAPLLPPPRRARIFLAPRGYARGDEKTNSMQVGSSGPNVSFVELDAREARIDDAVGETADRLAWTTGITMKAIVRVDATMWRVDEGGARRAPALRRCTQRRPAAEATPDRRPAPWRPRTLKTKASSEQT